MATRKYAEMDPSYGAPKNPELCVLEKVGALQSLRRESVGDLVGWLLEGRKVFVRLQDEIARVEHFLYQRNSFKTRKYSLSVG